MSIETCVMCGEDTPYWRNDDISKRNFYVEGAGQLCKKCFEQTYS